MADEIKRLDLHPDPVSLASIRKTNNENYKKINGNFGAISTIPSQVESIQKKADDAKQQATSAETIAKEANSKSDYTQSQLDQVTGASTIDPAVEQMKVGSDGTTIYPSPDARVRTEHNQLSLELEENGVYPKSLGAKIDGTSNDTGIINEAIATGKKLHGNGVSVVTSLENPLGFDSDDSLKIIRQSDGYLYNSYADKYNRIIFGQEYLSYFHRRIASGSGMKILFSGDSTTAGVGLLEDYRIHNLIKTIATNDGFYNVTTVNRGQSGKTSSDWLNTYLSGDIAENADLGIFRWGINDPENGGDLATFLSNMRSGLQQLRANKDYTQQSIVIMMPNTTSDSAHGRGELWYESMVNGLKRLARDFKCVFIDTYAHLQDSRNAFDYMDSTYNGASSMHPKEIMNLWIADIIYETLFPRTLKLLYAQPEPISLVGSLQNGWFAPSGFRTPGYWFENGSIMLRGVISAGTLTPGTVLFKLPITLATATFLGVGTRGGGGTLMVDINGDVKIETLIPPQSGNQWITFEGEKVKLNRNIVSLP